MSRDNKRLNQIRSLPCCACGASPRSQAAHSNFGIHGKAKGMKADDEYTIPLCVTCHQDFDQMRMGLDREQSLRWFMGRLQFINGVLDDKSKDETSIF